MAKVFVINGSPHKDKGMTGALLAPFIEGMRAAGADVEQRFASDLNVNPCACENIQCWFKTPGQCVYSDDMDLLYPLLKESDCLVFATPVYIPLPGALQNFINRLCPLVVPDLQVRDGRTRARFGDDVKIKRMALVCTSGWWEIENCDTVLRVVKEYAATTGSSFAGALLRPHSQLMFQEGKLTHDGTSVMEAAHEAGRQLIERGEIQTETLSQVSRPLITREELKARREKMMAEMQKKSGK